MGCWDEYCVVCGGPPGAPVPEDIFVEEAECKDDEFGDVNFPDFEWLGSFVGINEAEAEEVIPLGEYRSYGSFDLADGPWEFGGTSIIRYNPEIEVEPNSYGLLCHEKCYKVLERDLPYTLRFHDVWPMLMQQEHGGHLAEYTDYGGMEPYNSEQFFWFIQVFVDGKQWMLQDPMTHRDNAERILKVWRPFVESKFKVDKIKQPEPQVASGGASEGASEGVVDDTQTASQQV